MHSRILYISITIRMNVFRSYLFEKHKKKKEKYNAGSILLMI